MTRCPVCAAQVATDDVEAHRGWHELLARQIATAQQTAEAASLGLRAY